MLHFFLNIVLAGQIYFLHDSRLNNFIDISTATKWGAMSTSFSPTWPLTVSRPAPLCAECAPCGVMEGPPAYRRVMRPPPATPTLADELRLEGVCPHGHKSAGKAGLYLQRLVSHHAPRMIYSPHRDKVRHGHCLCTWAFIKQPGWALCRGHSNVQGAD